MLDYDVISQKIEKIKINNFSDIVSIINDIAQMIYDEYPNDELFDIYQVIIFKSEKLSSVLQLVIEKQNKEKKSLLSMGFNEAAELLCEEYIVLYDKEIIEEDEKLENYEYDLKTQEYDSVKIYLSEMAKIPLLSKEEEYELTKKYFETRDINVRKKIVEHNLRLVASIARKYMGKGLSYEDLIQEGNIGLMKAIDRYDPNKNFRLSTYSVWWIRQSIDRAIKDKVRSVRLPNNLLRQMSDYYKKRMDLENVLGREVTDIEMAKHLGISLDMIKKYKELYSNEVSLNSLVGDGDDKAELGDFIVDTSEIGPEEKALLEISNKETLGLLDILTKREQMAIMCRYGLDGTGRTKSLDEISVMLGFTKEGARQIILKALRKMRKYSEEGKPMVTSLRSIKDYFNDFQLSNYEIKVIVSRLSSKEIRILNEFYCGNILRPIMVNPKCNMDEVKAILDTSVKREIEYVKKIRKEKKQLKEKKFILPSNLYSRLHSLGYSNMQITLTLKKMDEEDIDLLKSIYGDDLKSNRGIINLSDSDVDKLKEIIQEKMPKLFNELNYNIYTYLKKQNMSILNLENVLLLLDLDELVILYKYFGYRFLNENVVFETEEECEYVYLVLFPKIQSLMQENLLVNEQYRKSINNLYNKLNCSSDDVERIYGRLDVREANTLKRFYEESEENRFLKRKIIKYLFNFSMIRLGEISEKIDDNELKELVVKAKAKERTISFSDDLYAYYINNGYSKEEIDTVVSNFSLEEKEVFKKYYGEDIANPSVIDSKIKKKYARYIASHAGAAFKLKLDKNRALRDAGCEDAIKKRSLSSITIYEYFENKGYSEEEIDVVLESLNEKQKQGLENYYGEDLKNPTVNENIDIKDFNYVKGLIYSTISKKLELLRKNGEIINRQSFDNIYDYFKRYGFDSDKVDEAIKSLNEEQKKILLDYYKDLKNPTISDDIAVMKKAKYIVAIVLKRKLKNRSNNRVVKKNSIAPIYKYFTKLGYTVGEIEVLLSELNDSQRNKLKSYYGDDLEHPVINEYAGDDLKRQVKSLLYVTLKRKIQLIRDRLSSLENFVNLSNQEISELYLIFCLYDNVSLDDLKNINPRVLEYLISNNYIIKKDLIYDIDSSKVYILMGLYNKLKNENNSLCEKVLDKCYRLNPNILEINEYKVEECILNNDLLGSLKYLKFIIDNCCDIEKLHKYNFILVMLAYSTNLPREYVDYVYSLNFREIESNEEDILVRARINEYRYTAFKGNLNKANTVRRDTIDGVSPVISNLFNQATNRRSDTKKKVLSLIMNKQYQEAYNLIKEIEESYPINTKDNITKRLLEIILDNKVISNMEITNAPSGLINAIYDGDFKRAIELVKEKSLDDSNLAILELLKVINEKDLPIEKEDINICKYDKIVEALKRLDEDNLPVIIDGALEEIREYKIYLAKYPNIKKIVIGKGNNRRLILKKINEKIDNNDYIEMKDRAQINYENGNYKEALCELLKLNDEFILNDTRLYYQIAVCYIVLMDDKDKYLEKARLYLNISNELSKYNGIDFLGDSDIDSVIIRMKDYFNNNSVNKEGKVIIDYDKLLYLYLRELSIDEILDPIINDDNKKLLVKLQLCKKLYQNSYFEQGNLLMKEIERISGKSDEVIKVYNEVLKRKKFYKNN